MQGDPSLGGLTVRFVEAEYDADYVTGAMDTYCIVWLLEKTRWKRRKSRTWGRAQGDPMHPEWGQEFEFYDVRDDATGDWVWRPKFSPTSLLKVEPLDEAARTCFENLEKAR